MILIYLLLQLLAGFYQKLTQTYSRNLTDYITEVLKHVTYPKFYNQWKQLALQQIFTENDVRNSNLNQLAQGLLEVSYFTLCQRNFE